MAAVIRSPHARDAALTLAVTAAGALLALVAIEVADTYVTTRRDRVLIIFLGIAVAVLVLPLRRTIWSAAALVATWVAGWLAFAQLSDDVFADTPVDQAVGGAAFYATPYIPQQLAAVFVGAIVLGGVLAAVVIARRRGLLQPVRREDDYDRPERPWVRIAALVALALIALTIVPNLSAVALGDPLAEYKTTGTAGEWDLANLMTWQWLVEDGAVAMKDFFWPYGETWIFELFPLGRLWEWLARCLTFAVTAWALWRLSPPEGRAVRVVLCALAFVLVASWAGLLWRYAVPLSLALAYAAVGPARHRTLTWRHLVLAVAAANAALWGVDALLYGVAGMAFVLLGELVSGRVALRPIAPLARGMLVDAVAMLALLVAPLVWMIQGSLEENLRFALGLRGVSAASALVQDAHGALHQFIGFKPTYEMVSVLAPALFLAAGLVAAILGGRRGGAVSAVLLAAGGVSSALLLKHLVRPQGDLMLVLPVLAAAWCAILAWESRRWLLAATVGATLATLLWMIDRPGSLDPYIDSAANTPSRIVDNLELTGKDEQIAATDATQFRPANLPPWAAERSLAAQLTRVRAREADDSFAVLGDAPFLYVYFKQRPPFHVELYDASTRDEQEAMVDALEADDPNLIFWRRDFVQDGVPQGVRNPIVVKWVVEHYELVSRGRVSDVLRRRTAGGPPDETYWRPRLGDPFQVGFVPAASAADDADECSGGEGCNPYAVLAGSPTAKGQIVSMTITGRGRSFSVTLFGRPGETEYPVRLDRLWFSRIVGSNPTVRPETAGFEARLERRRTGDALW